MKLMEGEKMAKNVKIGTLLLGLIFPFLYGFSNFPMNPVGKGTVENFHMDADWKYVEKKAELGNNEEVPQKESLPQLTDEQVKQLEDLALEMLDLRKQMVDKYVEFGIMTEERAQKMKEHFDRNFQKMREAKFMPHWENYYHPGRDEGVQKREDKNE